MIIILEDFSKKENKQNNNSNEKYSNEDIFIIHYPKVGPLTLKTGL